MKFLVIPVGIPGLGKSSLLQQSCAVLNDLGVTAYYNTQDNYTKRGKNTPSMQFISDLKKMEGSTVIIADRCNHAVDHRRRIVSEFPNRQVIYIDFIRSIPQDELIELAHGRIMFRGASHAKLKPCSYLRSILSKFVREHEPLTETEKDCYIGINPYASKEESLRHVLERFVELNIIKTIPETFPEMKPEPVAQAKIALYVLEINYFLDFKTLHGALSKSRSSHITMRFFNADAPWTPEIAATFKEFLGRNFTIRAIRVVSDKNGSALKCLLPEEIRHLCSNDHPHITIKTAPDVPPAYSNELLAKDLSSVESVPCDFTFTATMIEYFK